MAKKKKDHAAFDAMKKGNGNMGFKNMNQSANKKGMLRQKQMGK